MAQPQVNAYEPSALDRRILGIVSQDEGIALTVLSNTIFPDYTGLWVWERCRRLSLAGLLHPEKRGNRLYLYTAAGARA